MPIYEFCAENVTLLDKAFKAGAQRVELCDNRTSIETMQDSISIPSYSRH